MAGFIEQATLPKQIEQKIESMLAANVREPYLEAVIKGMKIAARPNAMNAIMKSKDPVKDCATSAINLTLIMNKESRGSMPSNIIPAVAVTLFCQALDFIREAKLVDAVSNNDIDRGMHIIFNQVMLATHMTQKKFDLVSKELEGIVQDPSKVEKMQLRTGVVRHPNAVMETPGLEPQGGQ